MLPASRPDASHGIRVELRIAADEAHAFVHRRANPVEWAPVHLTDESPRAIAPVSATSNGAHSRTSSTTAASSSSSRDLTHEIRIDEPVDFVYHLAAAREPIDYLRLPLQR